MPLPLRRVFQTWWPLAASWMLMACELPVVNAVMARMADPEISLAAYGGVVFPLSLLIEAPIIMLLAASTALCKDWASYCLVRRFMIWSGLALTLVHVAVAFTPLFYVVVGGVMGVPDQVLEPTRWGLMIMTPWTGAIAYRRFQQGILIRFGHSKKVGAGTLVRLFTTGAILSIGFLVGGFPGIVVGASGIAAGVTAEAIVSGFWVRPVLNGPLRAAPPLAEPLTWRTFYRFYVPLAMTSLITLLSMPIGSAGMTRMPKAIDSLAVWPVLNGLTFIFRGIGLAFNEVVVALADEPGSLPALRKAAAIFAIGSSLGLGLVVVTPASDLWLISFSALPAHLLPLAGIALWFLLPFPAQAFLQSYYQGILVNARKTRGITESVAVFLLVTAAVITIGIALGSFPGLYVTYVGVFLGSTLQLFWLWHRSRGPVRALESRSP